MNLNINEMTAIVDSIKSNEKMLDKVSYDDVRKYIIEKHNEAHAILKEVAKFLKKNISIFENKRGMWSFRGHAGDRGKHSIGESNPFNCVIRRYNTARLLNNAGEFQSVEVMEYWTDGGIFFREYNGKICYVSTMSKPHPYGYSDNPPKWNISDDNEDFNMFPRYFKSNYFADWIWEDLGKDALVNVINEFNASEMKRKADEDLAHAHRVVEALMKSLRDINKSVNDRIAKSTIVRDDVSATKTTKYVIEVTRIDD